MINKVWFMKSSPEISLENEILVNEMSKRRSKTMMMLALCINILGLAFIFGSVTQFNRGLIKVQEDYSRVQALHGKVLRIDEILTMCRDLVEDPDFPTVKRWRDGGGKVLGHFQVYFPEEIAHAAGMLPLKMRARAPGNCASCGRISASISIWVVVRFSHGTSLATTWPRLRS